MSNRRTRRHPPRPAPKPLQPPRRALEGWTLEQLADATGGDRRQLLRLLVGEVAAGRVVEMHCAGRTLYARLGGGQIGEVQR